MVLSEAEDDRTRVAAVSTNAAGNVVVFLPAGAWFLNSNF